MAKTLLVLGPAGAGKTLLVQALARAHPGHQWHRVELVASGEGAEAQQLPVPSGDWAGIWRLGYDPADPAGQLTGFVGRIAAQKEANRTIIAFESQPDPGLRYALDFDLQAFVVPPVLDETEVFRTVEESRQALQEIMRQGAALGGQAAALDPRDGEAADPATCALSEEFGLPAAGELHESHVQRFLACPLGVELATRVHLQPAFSAIVDADLVILNPAAKGTFRESHPVWQKLQALLNRLKRPAGRQTLVYICDLTDGQDPSLVRVLRRMEERLTG